MTHYYAAVDEDTCTVFGVGETQEQARRVASVRGGAHFRDPSELDEPYIYRGREPVILRCTPTFAKYCQTLAQLTGPPSYSTVVLNWKKQDGALCLLDE